MRLLCIGIPDRPGLVPPGVLEPTTEVVFRDLDFAALGLVADSYVSDAAMDVRVLAAGASAEQEGFDAVVSGSVSDMGLYALRSRLTIPVVGPGIVAFHLASLLAGRFSIVTTWKRWEHFAVTNLLKYGLSHKLASIRNIGVQTYSTSFATGNEPDAEAYAELVATEGRLAVEEDGAEALVIGSNALVLAIPALRAAVEVPVIEPGISALKMAESLVKLSLSQSKATFQSPHVDLDHLL